MRLHDMRHLPQLAVAGDQSVTELVTEAVDGVEESRL
jgi:hypothetical protein